jgi:hypothetical protein
VRPLREKLRGIHRRSAHEALCHRLPESRIGLPGNGRPRWLKMKQLDTLPTTNGARRLIGEV